MGKKSLLRINVSLLLLIIVSLFCSCTGEMNILEENNKEQINFDVSVPEWQNTDSLSNLNTSRATPITDASLSTSNTFNLIADQNDGAGNYSTLINNAAVSSTNNIWQTTPSHYYWSGIANKTVNFYAYYPNSIFSSITHTAGSSPTLSYTVPPDASNQIDIMTATANNISGNTNSSTPLIFYHIFAAVKFAVGTNGLPSGTIKSISINGIHNLGTYTFGSGWALGSSTSTFTVSPSTNIAGVAGANITSDAFTLMMIPQVFSNADVSLVYNNGTTFSAKISGTWNAGGVYTYKLSKTIVSNYEYTGAVQTFIAPYTGTYKLEVWGAQGGRGGYGGYSYGNLYVTKGTSLYIYIGGVGSTGSSKTGGNGGYNGGGHGGDGYTTSSGGGGGGGGATHIAITDRGVLSSYSGYSNDIEIVAGGGGGTGWGSGGTGGGISGGKSGAWDDGVGNTSIGLSYGGTQTDGYAFGFGQNGRNSTESIRADDTGNGGGGGGWYGGYSYQATGYSSNDSGGGGSGHLGINLISGTTGMSNGVRSGDGYARITFVSAN